MTRTCLRSEVPDDQATADFIITHANNQTDLPKVLIVGDSISGGYSKPLIDLLEGKVELTKLGAVAGYRIQKETFWHSRGEAKNLDFGSAKACIVDFERFGKHLDDTPYDVIHFNFGLNSERHLSRPFLGMAQPCRSVCQGSGKDCDPVEREWRQGHLGHHHPDPGECPS